MSTLNVKAAQDAPAAGFDVTVNLTDAEGKAMMTHTPNIKLVNGTKTLDVYEVNPVHLIPGVYRVVLQQALVKSIIKDDVLSFTY